MSASGNGKRGKRRHRELAKLVPEVGRPPALTPTVETKFLKALRDGNMPEVAARACGIGIRTYYGWMQQGKDQPDSYYATLRKKVLQNRAQAIADRVATLAKASGKGNVQAAMFFLERHDPMHWGRRDKLQLETMVRQDDLLQLVRQMAGAVQDNVTDQKALLRIKSAWLAIMAQHYPEAVATASGQIDAPPEERDDSPTAEGTVQDMTAGDYDGSVEGPTP